MMLREKLKQEIDTLDENQLSRIAEFVMTIKEQGQPPLVVHSFWQRTTPKERAQKFRAWVAALPESEASLPDEAFDRESIYE